MLCVLADCNSHTHTYIYIYVYVCTSTHTHTYIYIYIYISPFYSERAPFHMKGVTYKKYDYNITITFNEVLYHCPTSKTPLADGSVLISCGLILIWKWNIWLLWLFKHAKMHFLKGLRHQSLQYVENYAFEISSKPSGANELQHSATLRAQFRARQVGHGIANRSCWNVTARRHR